MLIRIEESKWEEAYYASLLIPEFEPWYPWEKWQDRLKDKEVISLIAKNDEAVAGFKVGYYAEDHFYSWVGGVLPAFRRQGIAHQLAEVQEELVRKAGVPVITMKTRNCFPEMLRFATGRGFNITGVERKGAMPDWRITLHKNL